MTRLTQAIFIVAAAAVIALLLAGCGGSADAVDGQQHLLEPVSRETAK